MNVLRNFMDAKRAADVSGPMTLEEPVSNHSHLSYALGDAAALFSFIQQTQAAFSFKSSSSVVLLS
jgi:hypothetical protein